MEGPCTQITVFHELLQCAALGTGCTLAAVSTYLMLE